MNAFQLISSLWKVFDGHKFNSGAAIAVLAIIFQQVLSSQGVGHDQAVSMATYIIEGAGSIIMVVGYLHKLIKGKK
jgi:hypothetical protein